MSRIRLVAAFAVLLFATAQASAAIQQFEAFLDGLQETPPNGFPGTGSAVLFLNDSSGAFSIAGDFTDLVGTTTAAHIHGPALPGAGAGVITPLTISLGATNGAFSADGTYDAAHMADLLAGKYYVNIHTTVVPGGEIRGQLTLIPEPSTFALLGLGAAGLAIVAWRRRRASVA